MMKKLICLLTITLLSANVIFAEVTRKEKKALIDLYESTNGREWIKKWNLEEPVSNWRGVKVQKGHVIEINLFRNNLNGVIPESIGDLGHLRVLNLAFNTITGELPATIVSLDQLRVLKLEMNRIKGELPETIGKMENLEEISLFNNFFTGSIPESIGSIKKPKNT